MKIRIRSNTIRFRLNQQEVASLQKDGFVEEVCNFPNAELRYRVQQDTKSEEKARAEFLGNSIIVYLNSTLAQDWCMGDDIGIYDSKKLSGSEDLRITVEKDFACLTEREGEDDTHAFPNPNQTC